MGIRGSKSKQSYEVKTSDPQKQKTQKVNSDPPAPPTKSEPEIDQSNLVPQWLNETQFIELLAANVADFSKIVNFRIKPAMSPGENYATLMLRISIDVELTDKSTKQVSYMMKTPHDTPHMQQMLTMANFFVTENLAYIDILPKMEALYKAKGLDIKFAPRAFKLNSEKEPKLANTVLMNDLGQNGFKNLNRLECLNLEQTKFALRKLSQYHAAGATMVQEHGPYPDVFLYGAMGKNIDAIRGFVEQMVGTFRTSFLANLDKFSNGEAYREKLEKVLAGLSDEFMKLGAIDPSEFNALNHGDCWMNNLLFKVDSKGELEDVVFVDFQNPKFGTPAMDLLYFIMTSVHIDYKLDYFDFFIRHYHEQLTKHLDILGFTGRQPSLRELHINLIKHGGWVLFPTIAVLPVVLLDPVESATFENFMAETEAGANFKNLLYSNKRYKGYIEKILPWLENRGFLEPSTDSIPSIQPPEPAAQQQSQPEAPTQILDWLNVSDFKEIISANEPNFEKIVSGSWKSATKPGDNYASKLLKVDIEAQLKDNSVKSFSYILKVQTSNEVINFSDFNLFPKEIEVYGTYVPAFEKLYKDAGLPVTFSAKSFRLSKDVSEDYLILENLQTSGFKMCDRMKGMDLEHTKSMLKKLAQWHAASLKYKELNGPYPPKYNNGIFTVQTADIFKGMFAQTKKPFLEEVAKFDGVDEYLHKLAQIMDVHVDKIIEDAKINEHEFNVLNHGDAWINNIMFQYDAEGHVKETFLLDHQVTKYGNPAQDLYYFIMSSTQLDIKVDQFDYLIRWYHQNLVEHTKLLKYNGFVPSLKELHIILLEHPVFAAETMLTTLTICLNKTDDNFSTDDLFKDSKDAESMRTEIFSNERYRANIERVMPWLNRRGLLDAFTS
ncbi:uncharacterized protein LOC108102015 [Drosophila ficusphila]|uniref:uncharacterized protein LOC108102015 n=1 Tax=Drosophila ficusphila TaxID=30025 RepID=UPI0007E7944B|nr:uncharacterized protein LOC108102015 [Drosophila ficusphila]